MSDDLLRQAELRHQRRPKSRQTEEILSLDISKHKNSNLLTGDKLHTDGSSLPPLRHSGKHEKYASGSQSASRKISSDSNDALNSSKQISHLDCPVTPRRRIASHSDRDVTDDVHASEKDQRCVILPFIKCKIRDRTIKALISTSTQRSSISHRLWDGMRCKDDSVSKTFDICGQEFQINISVNDSALHDLVFGMDFIHENHCILDFSAFELRMKNDIRTPFLPESDIPLKFRSRQTLASSI